MVIFDLFMNIQKKKEIIANFQQKKRLIIHLCLLLIVFIYSFLGGIIFYRLEGNARVKIDYENYKRTKYCVAKVTIHPVFF